MFNSIAKKEIVVKFDQPEQSSDAGLVLLKSVDQQLRLTDRVVAALDDKRQKGKIDHEFAEMFRQRVYGISCGYFDCNDTAKIGNDPLMALVCRTNSQDGTLLASQPTLSRFENAHTRKDLLRAAHAFADAVISRQKESRRRKKPSLITIDVDPSSDPTYGYQQLTIFNSYYDTYCYLPAFVTIQFDNENEQHLVAVILRPGNSKGAKDIIAILKRLVPKLRRAFPAAAIDVRLDGEFANSPVFDWVEQEDLLHHINLPANAVLKRHAEPLMKKVRDDSLKSGKTERRYGEFMYAAQTWRHPRRVVFKAERLIAPGKDPKDNLRFVCTNDSRRPKNSYRWYCGRGNQENRIKEMVDHLRSDLTSCTSFLANQFRCIETACAYALCQQLRAAAQTTEFEGAQVQTLREKALKVAALVVRSVRRIVLRLPKAYPWQTTWRRIALACGAKSG
jgi:hypothetical protein